MTDVPTSAERFAANVKPEDRPAILLQLAKLIAKQSALLGKPVPANIQEILRRAEPST